MYFPMISGIVIFHDNEQSDAHRPDTAGQRDLEKLLTLLAAIEAGGARPFCFTPLSISEGVPASVRNCREVWQAD
jgi:hypothetical protein